MNQTESLSGRPSRDAELTKQVDRGTETASIESQRVRRGELYGAVYGGYTIAHGIDIQGTGLGSFVNLGTIGLKDSGMFGGKIGYFFPGRANWAGVEVDAFRTMPDLKGTTTGATIAGFAIPLAGRQIPGAQLTVTTVALNAVARAKFMCRSEISTSRSALLQEERSSWCPLQPYAGVGLGVFFADLNSPFGSIDSPVLGLNVLAGIRYYLTRRIALFGEYKYNRASFRLDNIEGTGAGLDGMYSVSHLTAGLSLHW
jgi:opacity protein-like surface antigen